MADQTQQKREDASDVATNYREANRRATTGGAEMRTLIYLLEFINMNLIIMKLCMVIHSLPVLSSLSYRGTISEYMRCFKNFFAKVFVMAAKGSDEQAQEKEKVKLATVDPFSGISQDILGFKIEHRPSIYVLDTLGVLVLNIPNVEMGLKLVLTGAIKESVVESNISDIAQNRPSSLVMHALLTISAAEEEMAYS
eukprot:Gb_32585 [translate_table: standard]